MTHQTTRREALKRTAISSVGFMAWLTHGSPVFSQQASAGKLVPFLDEPRTPPNRLDLEVLDTWLTPQEQVFSVQHYGYQSLITTIIALKLAAWSGIPCNSPSIN